MYKNFKRDREAHEITRKKNFSVPAYRTGRFSRISWLKVLPKASLIIFYVLPFLILHQIEGTCADNNIYRGLIDRSIATYEDGCRAISCFVNLPAETMTFEQLVTELKGKGIIGKRWKYKAEKPLTRGTVAYMMCKILNIKGGLTMRLLGTTRRYAYLECQQMGILPIGHSKIYLSGHDLLALVYRMEQYIKAKERK